VQRQPVLIAEDNEDDLILIQALLQKANLSVPIHVITDGEQAISYLSATENMQTGPSTPFLNSSFSISKCRGRMDLKFLNGSAANASSKI